MPATASFSFDQAKFEADCRAAGLAFGRLNDREVKKVAANALRRGARVLVKTAKSLAPVGQDYDRDGQHHTGGTLSSKGITVARSRFTKAGEVSILARTAKRDKFGIAQGSKWYYPAIVEFGVKRGSRAFEGRKYMARSFSQSGHQAVQVATAAVMPLVEKLIAKRK